MALRVKLFVTCIVDQYFPRVGLALADVLERLGCAVDFPAAQTCCGQPAFNSGFHAEARAVARQFLAVMDGPDYIVMPSGSCTSMVRHHYAELFAGDAALLAQASALASRTYEFSEFLLDVLHAESTGARFPHTATFHDSCHALRELGIKDGPRRLLAGVDGLELREMEPREECCGFGGTFAVKFPELSGAIGMTKVDAIRRTGAEYVIGLDSSCLMQIDGLLRRHRIPIRTAHLAEVLAAR